MSGPYKDAAIARSIDRLRHLRYLSKGVEAAIEKDDLSLARYVADDARSALLEAIALMGPFVRCVYCGREFLTSRSDALTCSPRCRTAKHRQAAI